MHYYQLLVMLNHRRLEEEKDLVTIRPYRRSGCALQRPLFIVGVIATSLALFLILFDIIVRLMTIWRTLISVMFKHEVAGSVLKSVSNTCTVVEVS